MSAPIRDISLQRVTIPFCTPIVTSYGQLNERELIVLRVEDTAGTVAFGEAAPLEPYDGISLDAVEQALTNYLPLLRAGIGSEPIAYLLRECHKISNLYPALAAVDLAWWDLRGKWDDVPIGQKLTPHPDRTIQVNAVVSGSDLDSLRQETVRLLDSGYRTLKLKVGFDDDLERMATVREVTPANIKLRLDANGSWQAGQAVERLEQLAAFDIELCEEPVHGVEQLRQVAAESPIPVAIDESGTSFDAITSSGCQVACLKIVRLGGIEAVIKAAGFAREAGMTVYLASSYDGPLGIAAALHAATKIEPDHDCGLATLDAFELADSESYLHVSGGKMPVPWKPGLGVKP